MKHKRTIRIAQLALAAAATFALTGNAEAANHPAIILERPADLPELAQKPGEAMLLYATNDGRTLLYIEQAHGERMAIFDVTDPANIKEESTARLGAPGPFDFVSSLGDYAELVRFRDGHGDAVLNLHKANFPMLDTVQGLDVQGSTQRLGQDGFTVADRPNVQSGTTDPNEEVVDLSNPLNPHAIGEVKQVREEVTNDDTGTTFLLTADGLYVVRRPSVEEENFIHEWQLSHPG